MTWDIISFDKIDSTSDEAKRAIKSGQAADRQVLIAQQQDSGHGRYGRVWQSPPGNLYASLTIKIDDDLAKAAQYTFITSVAIGSAITEYLPAGCNVAYKWPNDVLVDGKKIAGILLESLADSDNKWLVIGFGVNILTTPQGLDKPVTCLKHNGDSEISADDMLNKILQTFETQEKLWQREGFSCIRERWLNNAYKINEQITVDTGNKKTTGLFKGINTQGELELLVDDNVQLISGGEVFF